MSKKRTYDNALRTYRFMIDTQCDNFRQYWLVESLKSIALQVEKSIKKSVKTVQRVRKFREIPMLSNIILEMVRNPCMCTTEEISDLLNLPKPSVSRYLRQLKKRRWLIYFDYGYEINPFLKWLIHFTGQNLVPVWKEILSFPKYQIDLLNLFTMPLFDALKDDIQNVEFIWSQIEPDWDNNYFEGYTLPPEKMYPYWSGFLQVKADSPTQEYHVTFPYNIHFDGKKPHVTLPIPFRFYGIENAQYSQTELKVHFDSSISAAIPLGSATWHERIISHKCNMRHWTDGIQKLLHTDWENQYSECTDFKIHEKLIKQILIDKIKVNQNNLQNHDIMFQSTMLKVK